MRVLHLYSGNLYGGVERLLVTLARERGHCPAMAPAFALCFEGRLSEELRAAGVEVHPLGPARTSRPWTLWLARRRLAALLRRQTPDVVVCHGCWAHAIFGPIARRARVPLAFAAHDVPTGRHWLERWARRTPPNLVIANSEFTRGAIPKLFPRVAEIPDRSLALQGAPSRHDGLRESQVLPCEVHYCPVPPPDAASGEDRERTRAAVRGEWGTPAGATVVLMSSRLERLKGHGVLLKALGRLKGLAGWECWIAGGPQRAHEERYLAELRAAAAGAGVADRVRFLGQRGDVGRLLSAADVHCQPNVAPEGLGLAFVEALYAGLPVVTSAIGGGQEVVRGAARPCGVLVPPGDDEALAGALGDLLRSPARRAALGSAGPARAAEMCDPRRTIPALYRSLARICGIVWEESHGAPDEGAETAGKRVYSA